MEFSDRRNLVWNNVNTFLEHNFCHNYCHEETDAKTHWNRKKCDCCGQREWRVVDSELSECDVRLRI